MNIGVNSSTLAAASKSILEDCTKLDTNFKNIASEMEKLNMVWSGEDASSYILSMDEKILAALNDLQKVVVNYANSIAGIGEAYDALDTAFTNKNIEV